MNRTPDVELVLREYLADDDASAPDHVLDVVQARISRQPQRRSWPFPGRTTMTPIKLAAALAAAIIVAVVGYTTLPRQPSVGSQSPTPIVTPSLSGPPAADATQMPTRPWWLSGTTGLCGEAPDTPYGCAGELAAGTHASGAFKPTLAFTLPVGWVNDRDFRDSFRLIADTPENRGWLPQYGESLTDVTVLPIAAMTGEVPCTQGPGWRTPAPTLLSTATIVDWVAYHGLAVNRSSVTMNGLTGERIDVQYPPDWSRLCERVSVPGGSGPTRNRVIVLEMPDSGWLVIHLRASPALRGDEIEPFFASAMQIVDSFAFDLRPSAR